MGRTYIESDEARKLIKESTNKGEHPTIGRAVSYSRKIEYMNFTGHTIRTMTTSGEAIVHEPNISVTDVADYLGSFVIKCIDELRDTTSVEDRSSKVNSSVVRRRKVYIDKDVEELNYKVDGRPTRTRSKTFIVKYNELESVGGVAHCEYLDIMIYTKANRDDVVHVSSPKAEEERLQEIYDSANTYSIEINSTDRSITEFYCTVNNVVCSIEVTHDPSLGDSFRIIYKKPNSNATVIAAGKTCDEELNKCGIFRKYRDADNYGKRFENSLKDKELEIMNLKADLELKTLEAKSEFEQIKNSSNKEAVDIKLDAEHRSLLLKIDEMAKKNELQQKQHEIALEQLKTSREEAKREAEREREKADMTITSMRMKDYYENRSHERKDSSEGMKFLPVFAGGALALFALLNK